MITAALQHSLAGIYAGFESAAKHAEQVSTASLTGEGDMAEGLIGLKLDAHAIKANAKVIRLVDDTMGSILDIIA